MRRTGRLATIGYAGAFALSFVVAAAAWATPHLPYTITGAITNSDASVPGASDITFTAFIQARPAETITQATQGVSIAPFNNQLWYSFDCSYFATQWASGDVLVVNMQNTSNSQSASTTWTLDNNGAKTLPIQLQPLPTLTLIHPQAGDVAEQGSQQTITWTSAGNPSPGDHVKIEMSTNNGGAWSTITESVANVPGTNNYQVTIPNTPSIQCLVRVTSTTNPEVSGTSGVFSIIHSSLTLTAPVGGEVWEQGTNHNITWTSVGLPGANVKLEYSTNSGTSWTTIIASTANVAGANTYSGAIPDAATKQAKVRVTSTTASGFTSTSLDVFTIIGHAAQLAFVQQPSNVAATSGATPVIAPSPSVEVLDAANSRVTSSTASVTLTLTGGGGSLGQLAGTLTRSAVAGLATFNDLHITLEGTAFILHAASGALTAASSGTFDATVVPSLALTSPIGAEQWEKNTAHNITWTSAGSVTPGANVRLEVSTDNGANWSTIIASVTNTNKSSNTYSWTVPNTPSVQCLVRVTSTTDAAYTSTSPAVFSILNSGLTLTAPVGGEVWEQGANHNITWMSVGTPGANAKLEYSANNGTSWTTIIASTANVDGANAYAWVIPDTASKQQALVRVTSTTTPTAVNASPAPFTIIGHAAKLAFVQQPSNVAATSGDAPVITPSPSVEVLDSADSRVTSSTASVTLALTLPAGGPGRLLNGVGPQLLGTNPVSALAGLATFTNLHLTLAVASVRLHATSGALTAVDSATFEATATPAPTVTSSHPNPDTAVSAGDAVVYTVTFGNAGLADAAHTVIVETLPADLVYVPDSATGAATYDPIARTITWQAATVAAGVTGSTVAFTATVATSGAILNGGTITNSQLTIICDGIETAVVTSPADVLKVRDQNPPAVSGRVPAADSITAGRLTPIKLHITDAGSGVDLTTVHITASRDGGATKDDLCIGLAADATSYNAAGNAVFKGAMHIVGTPADYTFIFLADAAFDFEETVTIGVTASDKSGNPLVPTPTTYEFTTETRSFGYNARVDGGTTGNAFAATATDSDGNIWIAWERSDAAGKGAIYLAERKAGANMFQTEIPVTKTGDCHLPAIAIAADNTIYLAYEMHGANPAVMVATATTTVTPDTTWTPLGAVTDAVTSETVTGSPAITVDSNGKLYVAGTGLFGGDVQQIGLGSLANAAAQWSVIPVTTDAGAKRTPVIAKDVADWVYVVWEKGANLYGANASDWTMHIPLTADGKSISPAIAMESAGNILHFVWKNTDGYIVYAKSTGGLPGLLNAISVLDQEVHDAGAPKVAVVGVGAAAKAFVVWQDRRHSTLPDATEIMFAETQTDGTLGTNIYVSYVLGTSALASPAAVDRAETSPALGLRNGEPYVAWTDQALPNGDSHIYFSKAMCGGSINGQNPHMTSVDITVPPGAADVALNLVANELQNPTTDCVGGSGLFTDGSGAYIEITGGLDEVLNDWVTITMHLAAGVTLHTPVVVYRLEPLAGGGWAWTHDYIQGEAAAFDDATQTWSVTFQTKHLSSFGVGSTVPAAAGGSSSSGGGGCSMSPNGEPDAFVLLLPFAALGVWVAIRLMGRKRSA